MTLRAYREKVIIPKRKEYTRTIYFPDDMLKWLEEEVAKFNERGNLDWSITDYIRYLIKREMTDEQTC